MMANKGRKIGGWNMVKRSGVLKVLVLSGTIAAGFAMNSTNVFAAEADDEPQDNAEQGEETQNSVGPLEVSQDDTVQELEESLQVPDDTVQEFEESLNAQDESIQKMDDATGVVEGDLVAEQGYLEEVNNAIEDGGMTFDRADELFENGEAVLNQAEEKNRIVEEELTKVEEETNEVATEFREQVTELGFEDLVDNVDSTEAIQKKIDIIGNSKETYVSEYEKEQKQSEGYQNDISYYQKEYDEELPYLEESEKIYKDAKKEYDDAYAAYISDLKRIDEDDLILRDQEIELEKIIEALDIEIQNNQDNLSLLAELQAKKEEAENEISYVRLNMMANGDSAAWLQEKWYEESNPYIRKVEETFEVYDQMYEYICWCAEEIKECTTAIEKSTVRQAKLLTQIENHNKIEMAASYYMKALKNNADAKVLAERSSAAYKGVLATYNELKSAVVEYKTTHATDNLVDEIQKAADKEKEYLDNAKNSLSNGQMTDAKAKEVLDSGKKVLEDAQRRTSMTM